MKSVSVGAVGGDSLEYAIHKVSFDDMTCVTKAIWLHLGYPQTQLLSKGKAKIFRKMIKDILLEAGGYEADGGLPR